MTTSSHETHVINTLGMELPGDITSLPGIRITDLSADAAVPADLRADVVFSHTWGAPNLPELLTRGVRWVQVMGVGVDKFPLDALRDDQILACARGATAIPIAEFSMASMMSFAKSMPEVWIDEPPELGWFSGSRVSGLHGKTVVVVGVGGIGARVAQLSLAFGMRVIGVRRRDLPSPVDGMEIATDLKTVIGEADHLVLAAPATADTSHLIDAGVLAAAKPGLHIVNVARGALIDQGRSTGRARQRAGRAGVTRHGRPGAAAGRALALHPSRREAFPSCLLGGAGLRTAMTDAFIVNYHRFRGGEPLEGVVDRTLGY